MSERLLTVVIPTFNGKDYILDTLYSLQSQNISKFQLMIVDDASTDNSIEIVKNWSEKSLIKVHFVSNSANLGLSETLNKAIKNISTKYFMILAQDDLLSRGYIDGSLKLLEKTGSIAYTPRAKLLSNSTLDFFHKIKPQTKFTEGFRLFVSLLGGNQFIAPGSIYLTSAIHDLRFDTCNVLAQDWEMWMHLSLRGSIMSGKHFIYYREHANNLHKVQSSIDLEFDVALALERVLSGRDIIEFISKLEGERKLALDESICFAFINLLHLSKFPIAFLRNSKFYLLALTKTNSLIDQIFTELDSSEREFLHILTMQKPKSLYERKKLLNELDALHLSEKKEKLQKDVKNKFMQKSFSLNFLIMLSKLFYLISICLGRNLRIIFYRLTVERIMKKYRDIAIGKLLKDFELNQPAEVSSASVRANPFTKS